jgi:GntR family transcriptional repressor for pyruvate dehydrogenase complex
MSDEKELFRQITQDKLYTQIYGQIIGLVENGHFTEGDRLPPERELARLLGVSRATLREALMVLQMSGIVKKISGQGTFIDLQPREKSPSFALPQMGESPFVILEARKVIEPAIAQLAAEVSTDESQKKIESILDWVQSDHSENQVIGEIFSEGDRKFHLEVACSTENPLIISIQEMIYAYTGQKLWLALMRQSSFATPNRWQRSLDEHQKIYEAIQDRNPELAANRVRAHLRSVERTMIQADISFDSNG